ncbi:hypothetical protein [Parathalassolituus penaei]|uniref:Uncharacterized protein n=1 Tax=Parathalassolituus penaei TaxID=2997323 RepID=A0A9X3EEA3_9GAMM|nr:hypothetical protein [Parathalassolituus penaei]MCY0965969.1 hypothetical protein [Parathalassolituus penaei]
MDMHVTIWLIDNLDLLLGFALLLLACLWLPAGVRWQVLTLGVALLAIQWWQKSRASERMAALDAQRQTLRQQLQKLDEQVARLEEGNARLEARRQQLDEERLVLAEAIIRLKSGDADLAERRQALESRFQALQAESASNQQDSDELLAALQRWQAWRDQSEQTLTDQ